MRYKGTQVVVPWHMVCPDFIYNILLACCQCTASRTQQKQQEGFEDAGQEKMRRKIWYEFQKEIAVRETQQVSIKPQVKM